MPVCLYLLRHGFADMSRSDIPYDRPPGPPLTELGLSEAASAARFLATHDVRRIYASPLLRARQTAHQLAQITGLEVREESAFAEWRTEERARDVVDRVVPALSRVVEESERLGSIALVSHGGTIGVMLRKLGMPRAEVDAHVARVGGQSPVPTAGVWVAKYEGTWSFELAFVPDGGRAG